MGCRHAVGAARAIGVDQICMVDKFPEALTSAREHIAAVDDVEISKFTFLLTEELKLSDARFEIGIIASTVTERINVCRLAIEKGCSNLLIEKPLGQSMEEVNEFVQFISDSGVNAAVNLSTRLYPGFLKLKEDFRNVPQLKGDKVISLNAGAAGIGGNGIHWLDLIFHLLDAERAELVAGEIEDTIIESGRGPDFEDYGGWCTIKFFGADDSYVGRAHLSLTAGSSALGGWDIIARHGRIRINLSEGKRTDILRKPESDLPIYRYAGDYLPAEDYSFERPILEDLSKDWIENIINGIQILPSLEEGVRAHQLLFEWLSLNKAQKTHFSFT